MISRGLLRENPHYTGLLKRLSDLALAFATGVVTHHLVFDSFTRPALQDRQMLLLLLLLVVLSFACEQFGLYRVNRTTPLGVELQALTAGWSIAVVTLGGFMWLRNLFDADAIRWLALWLMSGMAGAVLVRLTMRQLMSVLRSRGYNRRNIAIAGLSEMSAEAIEGLRSRPELGYAIVGYFDDRQVARSRSFDLPRLGGLTEMAGVVAQSHVDQVWVGLPSRAETRIRQTLQSLRHSTVDVCLLPDVFQYSMLNQSLGEVAGVPLVTLTASPMQGWNRLLKALEDRALAALILLIIGPVMLLIALAIRLDSPGPALFRQKRNGWNGEPITMLKFRSMYLHDESATHYRQAERGDSRITRVGAFLRRTSLDELPQFLNVLTGSMSIVGPRPYPVAMNNLYKDVVDRYMLRLKVKPGITGWAQINGLRGETRSPEHMRQRVQYDLYYIENWSIWFDLRIIAISTVKGFVHENAH